MKDYQRKHKNKYILPAAVYHKTIWHIRDYYRIKEEADSKIESRGEEQILVKTNAISDKVTSAAIRRENLLKDVDNIDAALQKIPNEFRKGVWDNIQFQKPYPITGSRSVYGKYKSKFIYKVAELKGYI